MFVLFSDHKLVLVVVLNALVIKNAFCIYTVAKITKTLRPIVSDLSLNSKVS